MIIDRDWLRNVRTLIENERFNAFVESLEGELADQDEANRRGKDEMLYRGQGKALFIAELLTSIESAREFRPDK